MSHYRVGCDAHKHYSLFAVMDEAGQLREKKRVNHVRGAIRDYLSQFPKGTPVALESVGNWYWIVDEIEEAGCLPRMAHAAKAKVMMGNIHTRAGHRQDRQTGRRRPGHPPAPGLSAHRLDRTGRDPRCPRAAPHPHGLLQDARRPQEPHAFDPGQVRPLSRRCQRYLRSQVAASAIGPHRHLAPGNRPMHAPRARTARPGAGPH